MHTDDHAPHPSDTEGQPDFGPSGYLPDRAARRARKIILRAPMGLGWTLAAGAVGLVVAIVGAVYLLVGGDPPSEPFAEAGSVTAVDPGGATMVRAGGAEVLVVRAGGGVRAFIGAPSDIDVCAESRRLEAADGVWSLTGRALSTDTPSLQPAPVQVFNGTIYVDPTRGLPSPAPEPRNIVQAC